MLVSARNTAAKSVMKPMLRSALLASMDSPSKMTILVSAPPVLPTGRALSASNASQVNTTVHSSRGVLIVLLTVQLVQATQVVMYVMCPTL